MMESSLDVSKTASLLPTDVLRSTRLSVRNWRLLRERYLFAFDACTFVYMKMGMTLFTSFESSIRDVLSSIRRSLLNMKRPVSPLSICCMNTNDR